MARQTTTNAIGLDKAKSEKLISSLNDLLAAYQVIYMNTRGFHWNVKGPQFFELHLKFEELYNAHLLKVDEVAERILTLGGVPIHTFSDAVKLSGVKESRGISDGQKAVKISLEGLSWLISHQRDLQKMAQDAGDEGTAALMGDYIREQEKLVWMYSAYLN
ncbi:MAG: DNA starvation/stationary phase protection protein [Bacteroidetes bacterium]|nr:DNA starvation/stationary phase protection protein [Bacteroidota bacterium]